MILKQLAWKLERHLYESAVNILDRGAEDIRMPTLAEFKRITARGVALVDFDVPWCASCHIQKRIIESLARRFCDSAEVVAVDVDGLRNVALELNIDYVPTLVLFKEGKEVHRFVGLQSEETLGRAILKALA